MKKVESDFTAKLEFTSFDLEANALRRMPILAPD